jgi:hypothetical protein
MTSIDITESRLVPNHSFMHQVDGINWYCQRQGRGPTVVPLGLLPCKHFPQVSIPDVLADHIGRSASRYLG